MSPQEVYSEILIARAFAPQATLPPSNSYTVFHWSNVTPHTHLPPSNFSLSPRSA